MSRINLKNPIHVGVIAIVVNNIGCKAVRASYLDAMIVDDLGADPWLEPSHIADDMETRFGIEIGDDNPLRSPYSAQTLRMRDLIDMVT